MYIKPTRAAARPVVRPSGTPLLRGLLVGGPRPAKAAPPSDAPKSEAPESDAPKSEAPESDAPKSDAPKSEAPESEAPASRAPRSGDALVDLLSRLGELAQQGVLTPEEFTAAKARLLGR
ncbi:SHOCT domain-containing protein [Streptomyces crystallinus]|uniref:SHOCT domain-containing protein n=1 Tax=Streptomyces crystallinus TaxID=68191 RepID=A0ABP3S4T5_9ACTN